MIGARRAILSGVPSWMLPYPDLDVVMDFANNRYFVRGIGVVPASLLLSCSRASQETYTDVGGNVLYTQPNTPAKGNAGLQTWQNSANLLLQSNNYATSWGTVLGATAVQNGGIAPDGTNTAWTITAAATSCGAFQSVASGFNMSSPITFWQFAKLGNGQNPFKVVQAISVGANNGGHAWFNLSTGAKGLTGINGAGSGLSSFMFPLANGWFIIGITVTPNGADTTMKFEVDDSSVGTGFTAVVGGANIMWGSQAEQLAFSSPYIPTTTVSTVRASDNIQAIGPLLSALKLQAKSFGVQFSTLSSQSAGGRLLSMAGGSAEDGISINGPSTPTISMGEFANGLLSTLGTYTLGSAHGSVALAGDASSSSGVFNGALSTGLPNFASGTTSATLGNRLAVDRAYNGNIQKLWVAQHRLSDATLKRYAA